MLKKAKKQEDQEAKAYNWVLLATILLILALIMQMPARIIANFLPKDIRGLCSAWGGTLWTGQVNSQVTGTQSQLRWSIRPSSLLTLKLGFNIEVLTGHSQLQAQVALGMSGWQLQTEQGKLSPIDLQPFLSSWQLPNQPIIINQLKINHKGQNWQDSQGLLTWQAGAVDYVLNGQRQHLNLPPVALKVSGQQQSLIMSLQDEAQTVNLATFTITGETIESRLTQRLLSYAPNYRGVAEPDAIVVTASQPLNSL